jgi:fructose-1,6-bisphosphatase/inositol monophosphatase family enzyme
MVRDSDIERVADLMRESAAAELLPRLGKLTSSEVREKTQGDPVTAADEACERRLAAGLATVLPGVPVVGEEAVAAEPGLVAHIEAADAAWIVDPLDGTANFARGDRQFAMIVALVRRGETVAGWIYEPLGNRLATATLGGGAYLDGAASRLPPTPTLEQSNGFVGAKVAHAIKRKLAAQTLSRIGRLTTLGCAGIEYLETLAGQFHFSFYRWTQPWDHAAGALMAREAGGVANRHDGRRYSPGQPVNAGILVASDPHRWQELRTIFSAAASPGAL